MAIDTKEKRAAALGVGRPWMRDKHPSVVADQEWRMSSGNVYGGNPIAVGVDLLISQAKSVSRFVMTRVFGRVN